MNLMPGLSSMLDDFNVGPLQVERRGARVDNQFGDSDPGAVISFTLSVVAAHNVTGRDLEQVPEADRNSEVVQFYTRADSWPAGIDARWMISDTVGNVPDVAIYNGRRYRIVTVRDFETQGDVWCAFGALEDTQAVP